MERYALWGKVGPGEYLQDQWQRHGFRDATHYRNYLREHQRFREVIRLRVDMELDCGPIFTNGFNVKQVNVLLKAHHGGANHVRTLWHLILIRMARLRTRMSFLTG